MNSTQRSDSSFPSQSVHIEPSQEHSYTIGDMAREFGVSLRTLRFYEDRGLLQPRRQGTARLYEPRDRVRLQLILKGKQLGFTLTEIRDLVASEEKNHGTSMELALKPDQIVAQISHLERQRNEIDEALVELRARQGETRHRAE